GRPARTALDTPDRWQKAETMPRQSRGTRLAVSIAAVLAVACAGAAGTGCAAAVPPAPAAASVSARGPITFATGKLDTGDLPGLVARWNARHRGQKVTVIYLPDASDEQHAQLAENLQARSDVYDVMSLDVIWTAEFAANGWISPVSPRAAPLSS